MLFQIPAMLFAGLLAFVSLPAGADDPWLRSGVDGQPEVQIYFFRLQTCPHRAAVREKSPSARVDFSS